MLISWVIRGVLNRIQQVPHVELELRNFPYLINFDVEQALSQGVLQCLVHGAEGVPFLHAPHFDFRVIEIKLISSTVVSLVFHFEMEEGLQSFDLVEGKSVVINSINEC